MKKIEVFFDHCNFTYKIHESDNTCAIYVTDDVYEKIVRLIDTAKGHRCECEDCNWLKSTLSELAKMRAATFSLEPQITEINKKIQALHERLRRLGNLME